MPAPSARHESALYKPARRLLAAAAIAATALLGGCYVPYYPGYYGYPAYYAPAPVGVVVGVGGFRGGWR